MKWDEKSVWDPVGREGGEGEGSYARYTTVLQYTVRGRHDGDNSERRICAHWLCCVFFLRWWMDGWMSYLIKKGGGRSGGICISFMRAGYFDRWGKREQRERGFI